MSPIPTISAGLRGRIWWKERSITFPLSKRFALQVPCSLPSRTMCLHCRPLSASSASASSRNADRTPQCRVSRYDKHRPILCVRFPEVLPSFPARRKVFSVYCSPRSCHLVIRRSHRGNRVHRMHITLEPVIMQTLLLKDISQGGYVIPRTPLTDHYSDIVVASSADTSLFSFPYASPIPRMNLLAPLFLECSHFMEINKSSSQLCFPSMDHNSGNTDLFPPRLLLRGFSFCPTHSE